MKKLFNILKEKLAPLSSKLQSLKSILPQKKHTVKNTINGLLSLISILLFSTFY